MVGCGKEAKGVSCEWSAVSGGERLAVIGQR
jgi:hypothetical protein